jgi:hypothetical protein
MLGSHSAAGAAASFDNEAFNEECKGSRIGKTNSVNHGIQIVAALNSASVSFNWKQHLGLLWRSDPQGGRRPKGLAIEGSGGGLRDSRYLRPAGNIIG